MNVNFSPNTIKQDTVLVIDDAPETLAMINDTLEVAGLMCLVSIDPIQGLNIAQKMQPDLILVDGLMPQMSGFDFCRQCKSLNELKDIPVIFMTGLSDSDSTVKAFEAGGVDYVTKPIDSAALIARIRVHLANAKIIRSTRLALDQAGQHVFAVNHKGSLLWQTPDVKNCLEQLNDQAIKLNKTLPIQWTEEIFWPAIHQWMSETTDDISKKLYLHIDATTVTLEILNKNSSNAEVLIKIQASNQADNHDILKQHFGLSARESEVLFWIAKGKTNREMGYILGISPRTINKHLEQVFKKLEVDNRTNAAAKAIPLLQDNG